MKYEIVLPMVQIRTVVICILILLPFLYYIRTIWKITRHWLLGWPANWRIILPFNLIAAAILGLFMLPSSESDNRRAHLISQYYALEQLRLDYNLLQRFGTAPETEQKGKELQSAEVAWLKEGSYHILDLKIVHNRFNILKYIYAIVAFLLPFFHEVNDTKNRESRSYWD